MARYRSELMVVENLITGKCTYYVRKCDAFQRVSVADYAKRYEEADGLECFHSVTTKTHRRSYCTCIYGY